MANLGWSPIQMDPAGPPWGWNPAATFMTAFYTAQENKLAQEKAARDREMEQILFPLKAQQAALELDKLQMEVERGAMSNQIYRKALRQAHSGQMQGLRDVDRSISNGGSPNQAPAASSDAFDAVPYQGADASDASTPVASDAPQDFPQENTGTRVASAAEPAVEASSEMGSNYNFSLAGTPFADEEPTNPLENLPTDNLGERIAMNEAATMGAGSPAGSATVADQTSVPVDMSLTRQDPARGSLGTAPNMLGAENPLERMADSIQDEAPAQQAQGEQARPQGSGDPFYDWSTQTLAPWVQEYKNRSAALSQQNANGRMKPAAFYSQRDALKQKADTMFASGYDKLDDQQKLKFNELKDAGIQPLDALVQVSTSRPRSRAGVNTGNTVDLSKLQYAISENAKVVETLKNAGYPDNSPELQQANGNLQANLRQYGQATGAIKKPQEVFFQADADLKLIPVYANKQRPLNGRTDYENVSAELQDSQLTAVREAMANNEDWVVDLTSYDSTNDGKLTEGGLQKYQSDVTERRKKYGRVAIFDGQTVSIAGAGAGDPKTPAPKAASATPETPASTEGPDSAKAAAKALRDIGKATGMEDPPHIYAKKMYERYVGKPFTDAAWPWVSTFLRELKQPAG